MYQKKKEVLDYFLKIMLNSVTSFLFDRHTEISHKKHNHEKTNAFFLSTAFYGMQRGNQKTT